MGLIGNRRRAGWRRECSRSPGAPSHRAGSRQARPRGVLLSRGTTKTRAPAATSCTGICRRFITLDPAIKETAEVLLLRHCVLGDFKGGPASLPSSSCICNHIFQGATISQGRWGCETPADDLHLDGITAFARCPAGRAAVTPQGRPSPLPGNAGRIVMNGARRQSPSARWVPGRSGGLCRSVTQSAPARRRGSWPKLPEPVGGRHLVVGHALIVLFELVALQAHKERWRLVAAAIDELRDRI